MKKEIVYTDKYALILDIEKDIEENMFTLKDGKIREVSYLGQDNGNAIIAHLPLTDAPIIEGVPLLPSFSWSQQDDVDELANIFSNGFQLHLKLETVKGLREGFIEGYNKAKEKYKYTEEDLKLAMNYGYVQGDTGFQGVANLDDLLDLIHRKIKKSSRPTHFECEVMCGRCRSIDDECWSAKECSRGYDYPDIMRTTTNSQGHIELVGKYI